MAEKKDELISLLSLRKGLELEDDYPRNVQVALTVSLIAFILMFMFVKGLQISPYQKKVENVTKIEEMAELENIEEPPPPPPKPQVQVEVAEAGEEETQQEEVEIQTTIEFSEFEAPPPPKVEEVYEFYAVEKAPEMISFSQPEYPEIARNAGLEGRVTVQVIVDENGNVIPGTERILQSTNEVFNAPALEAARKCKFTPGQMGDRKVRVRVNIPFAFRLK
ncbi:MAG: energy transducer TonB [candidate division WOR-3 bacterium]